MILNPERCVGYESQKNYARHYVNGFWGRFIAGRMILDLGFRGGKPSAQPLTPTAIGIERDFPGYDGLRLPFADGSVDTVHASHLLEHLPAPIASLREWYRVLRVGGTIILFVPHAYLYERRLTVPPSRWSPEHLTAYTPGKLLSLIETALLPNSYRVEHLADADEGYDYALPPEVHPVGSLEIECVLRKRELPTWCVEP